MRSDRLSWTTRGDTAQFGNRRRSLQLHGFILTHFHLCLEISRLPALLVQGYKSLACMGTMKDSRAAIHLNKGDLLEKDGAKYPLIDIHYDQCFSY